MATTTLGRFSRFRNSFHCYEQWIERALPAMMRNGSMRALSGSLLNIIIAGATIAASGGLAACRGAAPGQRAIAGEPTWTGDGARGRPVPGGARAAPRSPATSCAGITSARRPAGPATARSIAAWARSPMHRMTRLPDGRDPRAVRRRAVSLQGRRGALRSDGRRALHARRVGERRHAPVSGHQGDRRPLPRGLRRRGGARRRGAAPGARRRQPGRSCCCRCRTFSSRRRCA